MKLQLNEGSLDQIVRMSIGIVMLNVAGVATGLLFFIALAIGLIAFVTGITGFCPTYVLLGISTLPRATKDQRRGGDGACRVSTAGRQDPLGPSIAGDESLLQLPRARSLRSCDCDP